MFVLALLPYACSIVATAVPRHKLRDIARVQRFSAEEAHANVLKYHPAGLIIQSEQLYDYSNTHSNENHTIYIEDQRSFIPMTSVSKNKKRQWNGAGNCAGATRYSAENPSIWWDKWRPVSQCVWTGLDPAGGSEAIGWSTSIAYTETAGLDWQLIEDVLSASVGFSVTETFTKTDTKTCSIPGNSVGQVWEQTKLGSAHISSRVCQVCAFGEDKCQPDSDAGVATAPSGEQYATGCSTGMDNVQC